MSEAGFHDVLRRKAKAGREGHDARVMSPAKAMRQALSRQAEALFELALAVNGVQCERLTKAAMMRTVDEEMLFLVLDGAQGAIGAIAFDLSVVAGFVEQQTTGRVSDKPSPPRQPTATDAALIAPFVDSVLELMTDELGEKDGALTRSFRFGARIESRRHLELIVEAGEFHLMRAQLDLENGAKRGEVVLALPVERPEALPDMLADAVSARAEKPDGAASALRFEEGVLMEAEAQLRAILGRCKLSLAAFSALSPGDTLPLGEQAMSLVELDAGPGSERFGPCKLGQYNGMRAVQLRFGSAEATKARFEGLMREIPLEDTPEIIVPDLSEFPELNDLQDDLEISDEASGEGADMLSEAS